MPWIRRWKNAIIFFPLVMFDPHVPCQPTYKIEANLYIVDLRRVRNVLYKVNSKKPVTNTRLIISLTSSTASSNSLSSYSSNTSLSNNSNKKCKVCNGKNCLPQLCYLFVLHSFGSRNSFSNAV